MVSPNIQALKGLDNLKWDIQSFLLQEGGYQKALQVFNYSGEATDEYKENGKTLIQGLNTIKSDAEFLIDQAKKNESN